MVDISKKEKDEANAAGRREVADMIKENVLDPFALVAGTLATTDYSEHYDPTPEEIGKLLKLMVEGAHVELALYCSILGGPAPHPFSFILADAKDEF